MQLAEHVMFMWVIKKIKYLTKYALLKMSEKKA